MTAGSATLCNATLSDKKLTCARQAYGPLRSLIPVFTMNFTSYTERYYDSVYFQIKFPEIAVVLFQRACVFVLVTCWLSIQRSPTFVVAGMEASSVKAVKTDH